jgi:hypothetical protein
VLDFIHRQKRRHANTHAASQRATLGRKAVPPSIQVQERFSLFPPTC